MRIAPRRRRLLVELYDGSLVGLDEDDEPFVREASPEMFSLVAEAAEFLDTVLLAQAAQRLKVERAQLLAVARAWDDSIMGWRV